MTHQWLIFALVLTLAVGLAVVQSSASLRQRVVSLDRPLAQDHRIELCGNASDLLLVESLSIQPDPAQRGAPLTIRGRGNFLVPVEAGAYMDVQVKLQFIKLLDRRMDLCEVLPEVDMRCPVPRGRHELKKRVDLPSELPPGRYTVHAQLYTAAHLLLTCVHAVMIVK